MFVLVTRLLFFSQKGWLAIGGHIYYLLCSTSQIIQIIMLTTQYHNNYVAASTLEFDKIDMIQEV